MITVNKLAKMIDHSLLHPTMTDEMLKEGCKLARKYDVASVCIKPYAVQLAVNELKDSGVKTGTVIGFPHGNSSMEIKIAETMKACSDGASEIDMVINIGKAIGHEWNYVMDEISTINKTATEGGALLKVIFENDFLKDEQIIKLCKICNDIKVSFVKTSTGYGFVKQQDGNYSYKGATQHHLKLMRKHTDESISVKAAGGIRTLKDLLLVRSLGVSRIGATATAAILDEAMALLQQGMALEGLINTD
ncbi:MAG: deoxyribose-phosphate aldolase [Spirochaetales bacterium]|nr:deoxyribose-phosphate aldolase [Spirochaetales bacterium]